MKTSLQLLLFAFLIFGQVLHAQCVIEEDFDSYNNNDVPTDWTMINTTGVTQAYGRVTSNPAAPTPPRYFRMYNAAADTGELIFISRMSENISDGNHRLKFFAQGNAESNLIVGTTNVGDGSGTFTTVATISLLGVSNGDWEQQELVIPAGTDQFIFFQHNLGSTFDQVNIDSVCVEPIPTCLEVSNVALSNPTQTSVDLAWTESGTGENNWEYVVQEVGGGEPTTNGIAHTSTDSNISIPVTGLEQDTDYEAYVRANCGGGDFGAWIMASNTLRTDCGPITANYCEDWVGIADGSVPFCWSVYDDPSTGGYAYVDYEFSGYNKNMFELFFTSNTDLGDIVAISPDAAYAFDGNHRLNFTAGSSTNAPDVLEVGTIDAVGNFVLITTITPTSDRDTHYFVDLPNNDHTKFAFRHGGVVNKYVWINTVCVEDIPSCLEVTNVIAENVIFNQADITWDASGSSENDWEYLVQEATLPAPDAATSGTETDTNSVTVSLAQNTAYVAYARAKCDVTDFGAWIASEEFTTACDSVVAEYSDSFEGLNVSGEEVKPCWSILDTTSGDFRTYDSQNNILPSDGGLMVRMFFSTSSDPEGLILSTPETVDLSTDKQIRFKMNKSASTTEGFGVIVGTMSDPTDATTFVVLDDTTLNETSILSETWTEFTIDLATYDTTLNHNYIAFKPQHSGNGSNFKNIYMDEYKYEFNPALGFNDEAITAAVLTASDDYTCNNAVTGDYTGATRSAEFPCVNPAFEDYNDIWYRFTPETSGKYAFGLDTVSGDDMSMFIFEGSSVNLTPLSAGCSTRYSAQDLEGGVTYFVAIASPEPSAQFSLCVFKYPEVPTNDEIGNAAVLLESEDRNCNNSMNGYTGSATYSIDSSCAPATVDVWYTFTPAETGEYTFRRRFVNGSAVTGVSVYSGTPGNLTPLTACGSQRVLADLVQGEQYYVAVSTSPLSQPVYFTLCAYKSPPAPENDVCDTPTELIVGSTFEENEIVATNISATIDLNNTPLPTCGTLEFQEYGRDVWFEVVVPVSGSFVVETRFEDDSLLTDSVIETYTGECGTESLIPFDYILPSGNTTHCSDQLVIGGNQFAGMRFTDKEPGVRVLVRVWGFARHFGDFRISAYDDTPECNFPLDVALTDITETTALLTFDAPTPVPAGGYEYIVQEAGTGYPGDATGTTTNSTEVLLSNLTPETNYEVYVKSICSTNGSAWDGPYQFTTETVLGTNDFATETFTMYPNPVQDVLNVANSELIEYVTVYDYTGKKVNQVLINNTEGQVDMSALSSGLYMLEVKTALSKKVVKVIVE
tara:strand:- start:27212 stop:31114 length:3903 start_codon:yes stop_codon:yes gene_type:complete